MSAPLSPEDAQRYTAIIDAILATADLATISRKKIRSGLEQSLGGQDLSAQKEAIKKLIEERFDAVSTVSSADVTPPEPSPAKRQASTNGVSDDGDTDLSASPEPAKKKVKQSSPEEDADARLAAQLQAQENALRQSRTTRGGDKPRPTKKKKTQRKKSLSKAEIDDDSDVNASVDSTAKPKRPQKMFNLSEQLSDLCDGEPQLSRFQVVHKLWKHIKANDLQDPKDKRQIICDAKMYAVFKQAKVSMFKMNKDIGPHLYPVEG